jgi:beta-glucosidase
LAIHACTLLGLGIGRSDIFQLIGNPQASHLTLTVLKKKTRKTNAHFIVYVNGAILPALRVEWEFFLAAVAAKQRPPLGQLLLKFTSNCWDFENPPSWAQSSVNGNTNLSTNPLGRPLARKIAASICAFLCAAICSTSSAQQSSGQAAYLDPKLSVEKRVDDLVSRMTLEEKVSQIGHTADAVPRLGIPEYNWWNEGLHGVARAGNATVFPQAIGLAATFDEPLIHQVADAISTEFRAKYYATLRPDGSADWYRGLTVWSPNINIFRDPRWGRGQETYGEDPYLTSRLGIAFITGLQGNDPKYLKTVATAKHFAVHSGPESTRHSVDVPASRHDMEDTYLPAFRATVVEGQAESVMCAYNALNGPPACANSVLLQEHLRRDWGFRGYVVSDCGAITDIFEGHHFTKSLEDGVTAAFEAGTDLVCGSPRTRVQSEREALLKAVRQGLLAEADLDRALHRLFGARIRLGMFDPPSLVPYSRITPAENDTEAHRQLALKTARESIVLLKNKNFLPLRQVPATIAVIGPDADNLDALVGNYNGTPSKPVTILAGIRKRFAQSKVIYVEGIGLTGPVTKAVPPDALYSDSTRTIRESSMASTASISRIWN